MLFSTWKLKERENKGRRGGRPLLIKLLWYRPVLFKLKAICILCVTTKEATSFFLSDKLKTAAYGNLFWGVRGADISSTCSDSEARGDSHPAAHAHFPAPLQPCGNVVHKLTHTQTQTSHALKWLDYSQLMRFMLSRTPGNIWQSKGIKYRCICVSVCVWKREKRWERPWNIDEPLSVCDRLRKDEICARPCGTEWIMTVMNCQKLNSDILWISWELNNCHTHTQKKLQLQ